MSDQERPSEPEPTESGPEVRQRRAEELRAMALQSKEKREQQLAAASGAADTINPSDEMDVEEEGEKEKEKQKPAGQEENPETRASEAAEETESSSSYSSDSSDKPAAEEEKVFRLPTDLLFPSFSLSGGLMGPLFHRPHNRRS